jgi:hypothetical protein
MMMLWIASASASLGFVRCPDMAISDGFENRRTRTLFLSFQIQSFWNNIPFGLFQTSFFGRVDMPDQDRVSGVHRKRFSPPIYVSTSQPGVVRSVNSIEFAAIILKSDEWPVHGPMCEMAAKALFGAMKGQVTTEEARRAFAGAAFEARILVCDIPL